jgi:hypothetical protein
VTSGEKTSFLRTHPMWRMEYFALPWERLTTAQRGDFVACQPAFMLTLQLRWDGWEPEQRTIFVRKHPGVDVRIGWRGEGRDARRGGRGDQQRGDRARPMGPGQGVDRGRHGGEGGQSGGGQEQGGREGRGR